MKNSLSRTREWTQARSKPEHPYAWLWEPLESEESFRLKTTFGGKSVYVSGKLMLFFAAGTEPWRGVLICTDWVHHDSLLAEFPDLSRHPVLSKWLYLPESSNAFERVAQRFVMLVQRGDSRIGVVPQPKKRRKTAKTSGSER